MNFKQPAPVLKLSGETRAYEIVAGVYCQVDTKYLTLINLDAPEEKLKKKVFEIGLERVRDFAMDPTQNVIALVCDTLVRWAMQPIIELNSCLLLTFTIVESDALKSIFEPYSLINHTPKLPLCPSPSPKMPCEP